MPFASALKLALVGIVATWLAACASEPSPAAPASATNSTAEDDDSWWPSLPKLGVPKVHKIVVQQGNVITQQMVDRLKPGMTKAQVQFVLGRPVLDDLFDPNRWVYVYILEVPEQPTVRQNLIVYFEDEKLARFEGDILPTAAKPETAAAPATATPQGTTVLAPAATSEPAEGPAPTQTPASPAETPPPAAS